MKLRNAMLWIKLAVGLALVLIALAIDKIDPLLVLLLSVPFLSSAFQLLNYNKWNRDSKFGRMAGLGLLDSLIGIGIGLFSYAVYGAMAVVATVAVASQEKVEMHFPVFAVVVIATIFTLASIVYTASAFKSYRIEQSNKDREKI